jgi:hypothetical protein
VGYLVHRQHLLKVRQNNSDEEHVPAYVCVYRFIDNTAPIDGGVVPTRT